MLQCVLLHQMFNLFALLRVDPLWCYIQGGVCLRCRWNRLRNNRHLVGSISRNYRLADRSSLLFL